MVHEIKHTANELMVNYATMNKELRAAEVDIEDLEDAIQEAEDDGNAWKADRLRRRLNLWQACNVVLEGMLRDTALDAAAAKEEMARATATEKSNEADDSSSSEEEDEDAEMTWILN